MMIFQWITKGSRRLDLALTIAWGESLRLAIVPLTPLIVPGAGARANLARLAKLLYLFLVLSVAVPATGTLLATIFFPNGSCRVAIVGGFLCCVGGMILTVLLLKKLKGSAPPLWVPPLAGWIMGGVLAAVDFRFFDTGDSCWVAALMISFATIMIYFGIALVWKTKTMKTA